MALEDIDALSEKDLNAAGHVEDHKRIVRGLKGLKLNQNYLTFEQFGAKGDGSTDDTNAIKTAILESSLSGKLILGRNNAVYKISQTSSKIFYTGTGSTFTAPYCIELISGSSIDGNGCSFIVDSLFNGVAICNKSTEVVGDSINVKNIIINGNGKSVNRGYPLFILWGLNYSSVEQITIKNTTYIAASISKCSNSSFNNLVVSNVKGQGIMLGNGLSDLNTDCVFGSLYAENISDFGTFSQPGNGFCLGLIRSSISSIITRNCSGGIKYLKGCDDVNTSYALFDGTAIAGEVSNGTANSGIKIQGDDATNKAGRVYFDKIISRYCSGSGLYVRFAKRIKINDYTGYKNARLGLNDDVDAAEFEDLEIKSLSSESSGLGGITLTTNSNVYRFGLVSVRDYGDVVAANSYGISPLQGKGRIDTLEIYDDRTTQVVSKAIHGINDVPLSVTNYRTNVGNRVDIRSSKIFLGNPILSSGNSPLQGQFSPVNGSVSTDISNNNVVSQSAGAGFSEPIVEIIPMNAPAQLLGTTRTTVPSNFNIRVIHSSATGSEVFGFRVVGYTYRTTKPS